MSETAATAGGFRNTLVDVEFVRERLNDLVIVDARHQLSDPAWAEAAYREGHIPGALFAHLDRDLSGPMTGRNGRHPLPDREGFRQFVAGLGIDGNHQVVVYDRDDGSFAARLWWMLNKWLALDCAAVLDGGMAAWAEAGQPVESGKMPARSMVSIPVAEAVKSSPVVFMEQVRANIATSGFLLVDARGAERYRGEVEPMDAVAGHIPGALNRPFPANMTADGRFKSSEALRMEWLQLLDGRAPHEIVHHCGSGVTGCHNVLAMEHAGLSGSRIYSGSWSEWCTHPENPMVVGPVPASP